MIHLKSQPNVNIFSLISFPHNVIQKYHSSQVIMFHSSTVLQYKAMKHNNLILFMYSLFTIQLMYCEKLCTVIKPMYCKQLMYSNQTVQ